MPPAPRRTSSTRSVQPRAGKGPGAPASDHQIKQRKHILFHAAKLFAELGYASTTMDMLAAVTQMNKASLYYYYESKGEVLYWLILEASEEAHELALPALKMKTARDGIMHLAHVGIKSLYAHFEEQKILMQELPYLAKILSEKQAGDILKVQRSYMKIVYQVISQGVESGEFLPNDVRLTGSLFVSWMTVPMRFVESMPQKEMAETIANLFLGGISRPAD